MKLAAIFAKRQVKVGMDSRPRQRKQNVAGERGCGRRSALANVSNEELFPKGMECKQSGEADVSPTGSDKKIAIMWSKVHQRFWESVQVDHEGAGDNH